MLGAVTAGCTPSPVLPADAPPIAHVWVSKCGACHTRVEPGSLTRAQLEPALQRHRKRLRLTEPEWGQMLDFLADDAPKAQSQGLAAGK